MREINRTDLEEHLIGSCLLAGAVETTSANIREKVGRFVDGDPDSTFGLRNFRNYDASAVLEIVENITGSDFATLDDDRGWLDPGFAMASIDGFAKAFHAAISTPMTKVMFATGHPAGLLGHYQALARYAESQGAIVVSPGDGDFVAVDEGLQARQIRYIQGVACIREGGDLRHTHRPDYMRHVLRTTDAAHRPDVVISDHGFAVEAWEEGLPVLAFTDVNDIGLLVAMHEDPDFPVIVLDDNVVPTWLEPVTRYILEFGRPQEN